MKNQNISSSQTDHDSKRTIVQNVVCAIAMSSFWFGVFLLVTGSVISFVPGGECEWFTVTAMLISPGFLIPKKRYQIAAIILCVLALCGAYAGYVRGVNYHKWLQDRDAVSQLLQIQCYFKN